MITSAQYTGYKMEREARYLILKLSDCNKHLSGVQWDNLQQIRHTVRTGRINDKKSDLKCVVVEHDWPEYEPVWKMIEARVNMDFQQKALNIDEGLMIVARKIVQAVIQDEHDEGYDLAAGLFGPNLSHEMIEMNNWRKKAELYDKLVDLMGHVQNGTDNVIKIFQDDATMSYCVGGGYQKSRHWCEAEPSLEKAIVKAHEKHAGD